jgi:hypothetical protein
MDFEQSALKSQCEYDCSLIHEQFDDVVLVQIGPENGILGLEFLLLIFVTYPRVNVRKHGCDLHIMFNLS